jgi:hypothetical protein
VERVLGPARMSGSVYEDSLAAFTIQYSEYPVPRRMRFLANYADLLAN